MGCNMSLRRSVLDAVGGFDTGLGRTADRPLGCEETELCIRARTLFPDGRFLLEPRAVVHHACRAERASWRYFRARCRAEGVSKARVARRVGRTPRWRASRPTCRRVLPTGVLRNLGAALHGDRAALARAGRIVAGLGLTATGFLPTAGPSAPCPLGTAGPHPQQLAVRAEPVLPLVIDLSAPLPADRCAAGGAAPYASAPCAWSPATATRWPRCSSTWLRTVVSGRAGRRPLRRRAWARSPSRPVTAQ